MIIVEVQPQSNCILKIVSEDGRIGHFDVNPYLKYEAFADLKNQNAFIQVSNGGYYIEWECGADLSADTIEARWKISTKGNT